MLLGSLEKLEGGRIRDPETGLIFPWYTSPCLQWLRTLDLKGKKIFEYGVGDSTLWYRAKGAMVHGVDIDKEWAAKVRARFTKDEAIYVDAIEQTHVDYYDIVVVDGSFRDRCFIKAIHKTKPYTGIIIADNFLQASVEMDWSQTVGQLRYLKHEIYKEPGHPDWQTLAVNL